MRVDAERLRKLERLQNSLGIPLPAATQWQIVHEKSAQIRPAYDELVRQAAQGHVLYHDDTGIKILEWMGKRAQEVAFAEETADDTDKSPDGTGVSPERTGLFTSGIVSTSAGQRIALFLSGRQHAGENLRDVLANCLAHGRRQFVDIVVNFPDECRHVLEALKVIYQNDAKAREQQMSPEARLEFHQTHSQSTMTELEAWLKRQFDEHLVEPGCRGTTGPPSQPPTLSPNNPAAAGSTGLPKGHVGGRKQCLRWRSPSSWKWRRISSCSHCDRFVDQ